MRRTDRNLQTRKGPTIEVSPELCPQLMAKILPMTTVTPAHASHFNSVETGFFKEGDDLSSWQPAVDETNEPNRIFRSHRWYTRRWPVLGASLGVACVLALAWVGHARRMAELPRHTIAPVETPVEAKAVAEISATIPAPAPVADIRMPSPSHMATGAVAAIKHDDDIVETCRKAFDQHRAKDILATCPQAIDATPRSAEWAVILARTEFERGRARQALEWAKKAVALDAERAEAYVYLGGAEQAAGRSAAAKAAYRRYLQLAPQGRHAADLRAVLANL